MAEVSSTGRARRKQSTRKRKTNVHLDMTAMVDVAFLLLTFFVLTAVITNWFEYPVVMPPPCEGPDCNQKVIDTKVLTLVLEEENQIRYYRGVLEPEIKTTDTSPDGLRTVIMAHLNAASPRCLPGAPTDQCWDPIVVVKATDQSKYGQLVDVLDELLITQTPKYAIAPFTVEDSLFLAQADLQ
ncbi:MAG: biopolymer transporter ExbD [Bacteroidota bacterium]